MRATPLRASGAVVVSSMGGNIVTGTAAVSAANSLVIAGCARISFLPRLRGRCPPKEEGGGLPNLFDFHAAGFGTRQRVKLFHPYTRAHHAHIFERRIGNALGKCL